MNISHHLENALRQARCENARLINLIRFVGVAVFALTSLVMLSAFDKPSARTASIGLGIYALLSLLLWAGGRWKQSILWFSRFGIPLFDVPMVTAIQWFSLSVVENPGQLSEFSISVFVCLLMLSALTLNSHQIYLALAMSILGEQILQAKAGIDLEGRILSTAILMIAAWICIFARAKRINLVESFASAEVKRRRLQRYFSPGIGELLEEHAQSELQEGKECEITVLFIDIRGFTSLSEDLGGQEVVKFLNDFHGRIVDILFRHAGTLDKYTGDGLFAYFNAPISQPDHAERAIRCALDMLSEVRTNASSGSSKARIGIGIHTGKAIVGDIGAPHRREFTAIGDAVNVASRVEQLTKAQGVEILISEATAALTPTDLPLGELGAFEIKGRREGIRLFTPQIHQGDDSHLDQIS